VTPTGIESRPLCDGWQVVGTAPGAHPTGEMLPEAGWRAATVPGTAAGAFSDAQARTIDFDAEDWWFRLHFQEPAASPEEEVALTLGGLATVAEVYLNGELILESDSMFAAHELDVGCRLRGSNELAICIRALTPRLAGRRGPRARWRTRLVADGRVRFFRTMLLGRMPGVAAGPPVVGPWRPVALERRHGLRLEVPRLRARLRDGAGVLEVRAHLRALPGTETPPQLQVELVGPSARHVGGLAVTCGGDVTNGERAVVAGTLMVAAVAQWWPHTHGTPSLYTVRITAGEQTLYEGRVGFRDLESAGGLAEDGLNLVVNGVPVFVRGAVWTPVSLRAPHSAEPELRPILERLAGAGMNMLRVPGVAAYESDAFYDLCDELGILLWQDFMFANLDYPEADAAFMTTVEAEARALLARVGSRPCLAVLCGGSEVAQQVAMLGLDPSLAEGPLYGELLPRLVADAEVPAPYVPSAPWGGDLPFRPDAGIANYYGVGAYLRPLEDARRSEVRFAAECLAFANVPDAAALEDLGAAGALTVHHPAWKAGVPRDSGSGWDFDDVRDHYFKLLFAIDPSALRHVEPMRYLELSRAVSGEVMAEVFGEWRRAESRCRGALVLWAKDLAPGAGWGVLDQRGEPKVALHHLRRVLAPAAVWSTDEGLGGIDIHLANDGGESVGATLRVALYRGGEVRVDEASEPLVVPAHGYLRRNVETMLGRFVDASWAYRFGPPGQDLIVLSLERPDRGETELISQAFRFPAGRPLEREDAARLGLEGRLVSSAAGVWRLEVSSARFAYAVRIDVPGFIPADDAFSVEPGHLRMLDLTPTGEEMAPSGGELSALNLAGSVRIAGGPESGLHRPAAGSASDPR